MGKIFNIAGPCNPADHYMLPAMARLPKVMRLVEDKSYFVVHAQRQCGKTTALRALAKEINAKGERVAMYCSVEVVNAFPKAEVGIPMICERIRGNAALIPGATDELIAKLNAIPERDYLSSGIMQSLSLVSKAFDGKGALDLGVLFRGGKYAVEVKLKYNYEKNREKAYDQVCRYMDHLGEPEGWLVVFDPDLGGCVIALIRKEASDGLIKKLSASGYRSFACQPSSGSHVEFMRRGSAMSEEGEMT